MTDEQAYFSSRLDWFRRLIAFSLIAGGLICSIIAAMWFTGDFISTAVSSPNLGPEAEVADFNDFSYISQSLADYRFGIGALVLIMAIAVIIQGLLLLTQEGSARALFVAGGAALATQVAFLAKVFYWPIFAIFLFSSAGLYLATEWAKLRRDRLKMVDPADQEALVEASVAESSAVDAQSEDDSEPETVEPPVVRDLVEPIDGDPTDETLIQGHMPSIVPDNSVDLDDTATFKKEAADLFSAYPGSQPASTESPELQSTASETEAGPSGIPDLREPLQAASPEMQDVRKRQRVWNMLDWIIIALIVLVFVLILLTLLAR